MLFSYNINKKNIIDFEFPDKLIYLLCINKKKNYHEKNYLTNFNGIIYYST